MNKNNETTDSDQACIQACYSTLIKKLKDKEWVYEYCSLICSEEEDIDF